MIGEAAANMPETERRKTAEAVCEAMQIYAEQVIEEPIFATRQTRNGFVMTRQNLPVDSYVRFMRFFGGYSRQKYLKQSERRFAVWCESLKIAAETGADVKEVEGLFLQCMVSHIALK